MAIPRRPNPRHPSRALSSQAKPCHAVRAEPSPAEPSLAVLCPAKAQETLSPSEGYFLLQGLSTAKKDEQLSFLMG
jgi:hypothetical protein